MREAIIAANMRWGFDVIVVPGGTYQLSIAGPDEADIFGRNGDLDVIDNVAIHGHSQERVIIVGDGSDRIFDFLTPRATLSYLEITGGNAGAGGGVSTLSTYLTLSHCTIRDNSSSHVGGGIFVGNSKVELIDSTVRNNFTQGEGGGVLWYLGCLLGVLQGRADQYYHERK